MCVCVFSGRGGGDTAVSGRWIRARPGRRHEEENLLSVQTVVRTMWGPSLPPSSLPSFLSSFLPSFPPVRLDLLLLMRINDPSVYLMISYFRSTQVLLDVMELAADRVEVMLVLLVVEFVMWCHFLSVRRSLCDDSRSRWRRAVRGQRLQRGRAGERSGRVLQQPQENLNIDQ